ncbi:MAG: SdpI family protein [Oscillospiraceae bacterium]|nr:SdpI family protein [Oscillospiraceae bacterium]
MANDTVWQKSQRFGDIASVITGLVMIILALFVPGMWNILLMTVIIIIWLILCIVASHRYYLEQNKKDNT